MGNVPPKKVINADAGDADHVGGNDWDDLMDFLNNVDKTGPVIINTDTRFRSGKLLFRDFGNDHNYVHVFSNLAGNRNVTWPLLTADDQVTFDNHSTTLKNKTIDSTNSLNVGAIATNAITLDKLPSVNASTLLGRRSGSAGNVESITLGANLTMDTSGVLSAAGGGGGSVTLTGTETLTNKTIDIKTNSLILRENSWYIFKDTNYYARNGTTGALTTNSDFSTLMQEVFNSITDKDDTVRTKIKIGPGDFNVNTELYLEDKYNVVIEGSGMGITRIRAGSTLGSTAAILRVRGLVTATSKSLTANTTAKAFTITMSSGDAATFSVGDWVLIRSTANFGTGGSASGAQGEIKRISNIAGGTITFKEPLYDVYTTANSASALELSPARNITFKDFSIDRHPSYSPSAGSSITWWYNTFVERMLIENVEIVDFPGQFGGCPAFRSCWNVKVNNCHLQQNVAYNFQYGITFEQACQNCVVSNCTATGPMRHAFEAGDGRTGTNEEGACRNITFVNCTAVGGAQNPFDTHPEGELISFINCQVLGENASGGIKLRSRYSSVIGCTVRNISGIDGQGGIRIDDFGNECLISNCHVIDCGGDGIQVRNGIDGTTITGCNIINNTGDGIDLEDGCLRTSVTNCNIRVNGGNGIKCDNIDESIFNSNIIRSNTGYGIQFTASNCTSNVIVGNNFASNGSGAVQNGAQTGNQEGLNRGY